MYEIKNIQEDPTFKRFLIKKNGIEPNPVLLVTSKDLKAFVTSVVSPDRNT